MDRQRTITISAALIVLICFFLPWVQVSCGTSKDTLTGVDLANQGHRALWLIPPLMLAVLGLATWARNRAARAYYLVSCLLGGIVSAYLINRERVSAKDSAGFLNVRVTAWLFIALGCSLVIAATAVIEFLRPPNRT